ncbi:hypothetical protein H7X68_03485 [Candidatus Saccharibacteria bacterium]|nr:hypothetical protein [Candidatus Saccharibacteria bacterium]
MNPNQPDYSIDYLNQIAPQAPKKGWLTRKQLIIAGVLGFFVFLALIMIVAAVSNNSPEPTRQLAARLKATEAIVSDAQRGLNSTQLRTLNSNLKIYLTNANRDIVAPLAKVGINVAKLDKNLVASEAGATMTSRLEDARLNAVYDRTYAREIAYQLETVTTLMSQVYNATRNKDLKTFIDETRINLDPIQKQFAEFNAANG